jgi:hypothetical protein
MEKTIRAEERVLYRVKEIPALLGIGLTKVNEFIKRGILKTVTLPGDDNTIVWIRPEDLEEFKNNLVPHRICQ